MGISFTVTITTCASSSLGIVETGQYVNGNRFGLTRHNEFDFKVSLGDPIHCPAELGRASIVSQISPVDQDIACRQFKPCLGGRVAMCIGDTDEACFAAHVSSSIWIWPLLSVEVEGFVLEDCDHGCTEFLVLLGGIAASVNK